MVSVPLLTQTPWASMFMLKAKMLFNRQCVSADTDTQGKHFDDALSVICSAVLTLLKTAQALWWWQTMFSALACR